jgi:hypothetical protein
MRHDTVDVHLHYSICNHWALKQQKSDTHTHTKHEDVTELRNQEVHTDRKVMANMPAIIIKNIKEKICILVCVAVPGMSCKRKQKSN